MHTVHFLHILRNIWGPHFRAGDCLAIDQLSHHFSADAMSILFKLQVTPLFIPPGSKDCRWLGLTSAFLLFVRRCA